jgi:hypothetical protein
MLCRFDLGKRSAKNKTRIGFDLGFEEGDLIERHRQRTIGQIFILDIERNPEQADIPGLEVRQKIGPEQIPPPGFEKKPERQIEMEIDQPAIVQARDPVFYRIG